MKKKLRVISIAALSLVCLMFAACPTELTSGGGGGGVSAPAWGDAYDGEVTGTGPGYRGREVHVTLTLTAGYITDIEFDLRTQTAGFVRAHPRLIAPIVLRDNSFENVPVNIVADASMTTRGIIAAGNAALARIPGVGNGDAETDCNCPPSP